MTENCYIIRPSNEGLVVYQVNVNISVLESEWIDELILSADGHVSTETLPEHYQSIQVIRLPEKEHYILSGIIIVRNPKDCEDSNAHKK